jgi:hypothetical protein
MNYFITILKLLMPSIAIAYGIKYLAPLYPIAPTSINVLIAILFPSLAIAIWLLISSRQTINS